MESPSVMVARLPHVALIRARGWVSMSWRCCGISFGTMGTKVVAGVAVSVGVEVVSWDEC